MSVIYTDKNYIFDFGDILCYNKTIERADTS